MTPSSRTSTYTAWPESTGKLALVLTGLSVALFAIMALREAKELFGDKKF